MSAAVAVATDHAQAWPIEISRVSKKYGERWAIRDISLSIPAGTVCSLIGPSGSGKSTLLRCINGLVEFDTGHIRVGTTLVGEVRGARGARSWTEQEASALRRHTGIVFQQFNLFPHRSVLDNVTEAQQLVLRRDRDRAVAVAREQLARVGLAERAADYPYQLSGGQQQRVAIARALAMNPSVMLFDEVTSALDPVLAGEVARVLQDLAKDGTTMVVVTHEMDFARDVGDMVAFIENGELIEQGTPEQIFNSPRHPRTAVFVGR